MIEDAHTRYKAWYFESYRTRVKAELAMDISHLLDTTLLLTSKGTEPISPSAATILDMVTLSPERMANADEDTVPGLATPVGEGMHG